MAFSLNRRQQTNVQAPPHGQNSMKWYAFLITYIILSCTEAHSDLLVQISEGDIRGTKLTSLRNNRVFYGFLGIPYAEPPIGELRFQAPRPIEPWKGILDATAEGNICPQIVPESNQFAGDENCLYLNVYTNEFPAMNASIKPVLVWFHQGAFLWRSGNRKIAAPDFFMEEGVIFVSANSRLGPLGYLSLQTKEVPGNAGLKDQVLALKWVQRNIHRFGGDATKVTIVGESAGGNSVHLHMLSPMSKGLFHQAIASSGTALKPWYFEYPYCNSQYIENLGLNLNNSEEAWRQLTNISAHDLLKPITNPTEDPTLRIPFCPTIDMESPLGEVFLPDTPFNLLSKGLFHKVPFLIGSNSADGMKYAGAISTIVNEDVEEYLGSVIPSDLNIEKNETTAREIVKKIIGFYFGSNETKLMTYIRYITDIVYFYPVYRSLKLQSDDQMPQFAYQFSVDGSKHLYSDKRKGFPGASHGDEMPYLFARSLKEDFKPNSVERTISERLVKLWSNFVKTGNPTPEEDPLLQNVKWAPFELKSISFLNINIDLSLQHNIKKEVVEFWEQMYHSYGTSNSL